MRFGLAAVLTAAIIVPCLAAAPQAAVSLAAGLATPSPSVSTSPSSTVHPAPSAVPATTSAPALPAGAQNVLVPGGTTVEVALTEPVSSGTAKVNDQIAIVVKKDVALGGWTVIPSGSNGHATVTSAQGASTNGSGGKLTMSVDWVYSEDGGKIQLSPTDHASETGDNKGAASTATLLSWAVLGPLGFFAHNFVRGHDVTIGPDKTFTVFVDHDIHVQTAQRAAQGPGFDR